ncbi:MAG: divalent metal cation transporter [Desulfatirhabdiaceae bacterium]|nr:divalent metal cation transporter [Desulfatirhabdiaceae bacterium]
MFRISNFYYKFRRVWKAIKLYFIISGPGIVVMVADNDAGGITTYAATGAKYGYSLIWFLIILVPVAYYVQEMTVRLGAITKRGHGEAIFAGFGTFMAIGLFDAGLLGAICISLASSWAFGEVFGWAHSLNNKIREAPWFYANYFLTLFTAGAVVLIPNTPLVLITLFVQVIAVTLLPAALVFLILLLNNKKIMGDYTNSVWQNIVATCIVVVIVILSSLYGLSTLFPGIFK